MKILSKSEPPAFTQKLSKSNSRFLVVCDHYSNRIPKSLKTLGLSDRQLNSHIAWDIHISRIANGVVQKMDANLIFTNYCRLVADYNRSLEDPDVIIAVSDGVSVEANRNISKKERDSRISELYTCYHNQIEKLISSIEEKGKQPIALSLHSYCPKLKLETKPRKWHLGSMWGVDGRLSKLFESFCKQKTDFVFGDNLPYSGKDLADFTIDSHFEGRYPYLCLEIRHDVIEKHEAQLVDLIVEFFDKQLKSKEF